jgi:single-strand DNA-binding protein
MSEDLNSVNIIGRLTKNSELKYTNSGFAVLNMSIAVNRRVKKNDQWTEEASFFDVSLFGKRGESLSPYLTKGQQIAIVGSLKQERWESENGKRSKVSIVADNIQLLGKPDKSSAPSKPQQDTRKGYEKIDDGDIPF